MTDSEERTALRAMLTKARPIVQTTLDELLGSHCRLTQVGAEFVPDRTTLDPELKDEVAEMEALLKEMDDWFIEAPAT